MRVTSKLYVSALARRVEQSLGFATVLNSGANEAGAIYFAHLGNEGVYTLFGPAMQSDYGAEDVDDRQFEERGIGLSWLELQKFMEKEKRFDADFWLIEVELDERQFRQMIPVQSQ